MHAAKQVLSALLLFNILTGNVVAADQYPSRPIRFVVGFPAGGAVDFVARALASPVADTLGVQVVVDNRGGAHGMIANQLVTKAAPDGYTFGLVSVSTLVLNSLFYPNAPNPLRDYTLITMVGRSPLGIGVYPGVPAHSLKELIALAHSKPGMINVGIPGLGGIQHLSVEMINSVAKVKLVPIPYQGTSRIMTDLLGGQIEGMISNLPNFVGPAKSGKLRILAVTGDERASVFPDVPTAKEQGMPDLVITTWHAIVAPPNLPAALTNKLYAAFAKSEATPAVVERLAVGGFDPYISPSPADFKQFARSEVERWSKVVKDSGVKVSE